MKMYKGFDKDFKCRDFQYEVGKTYETDEASLCTTGFHACENPLDCIAYYSPAEGSRYAEVELEDVSGDRSNDSKRVGKKIKINAEISLGELIKASVDIVIDSVKGVLNKHDSSEGVISDDGRDSAQIGSSGDSARIGSSGYYAQIGSSGNSAQIGSSGNHAQIGSSGDYAVVAAIGIAGIAKAKEGSWITLAEYERRTRKATDSDFRAKVSQLLESEEVLRIQEELYSFKSCGLLKSEKLEN